jgi:hypothetical protein
MTLSHDEVDFDAALLSTFDIDATEVVSSLAVVNSTRISCPSMTPVS